MFVQVIHGAVHDPAGLHRLLRRWERDLAPGAQGWLGTTAGVTDDGEFVAVARFADAAQAQANSRRPEQGTWWQEVAEHFDTDPVFHDCTDVEVFGGGGSDEAGFVQVVRSAFDDQAAVRTALVRLNSLEDQPPQRPDLIGGLVAWHPDGRGATEVAYFTSEADARRGEAQPMPPDVQEAFDTWREVCGEVRYLDLRDPWLSSPAA